MRGDGTRLALVLAALLALYGAAGVSMERTWGWDESMHAELPAARVALGLRAGEPGAALGALLECERYPPAWPAVLGSVQAVFGVSEVVARRTGRVLWSVGLLGLFLLVRALLARVDGARPGTGARLAAAPWIALALGATSPLAWAYSGTLFLEAPFTVATIFALRAWLRRGPSEPLRREVAAGAWIAAALFTKWNYGLLLGFALTLALVVELVTGSRRDALRRVLALASVPALACVWWFLWPWPGGGATAASHRAAFAAFLGENRDPSMATPAALRWMHWGAFFVRSPRWLLVLALGCAVSLRWARVDGARLAWIVLLGMGIPIALHPFHLDRFHLPQGPALWVLAALGLAWVLPRAPRPRALVLGASALLLVPAPQLDGWWYARALGIGKPELRESQLGVLAEWRDLAADRPLPTNGLARGEHDALLDLIAPAVRADERIGWVGLSQSLSPGALHVALVARGVDLVEPLRRAPLDRSFVTLATVDPGWDDAALFGWARDFDLLLATRPPDVRADPGRAFLEAYQVRLIESGRWTPQVLGTLDVRRPGREAHAVTVYALRPAP